MSCISIGERISLIESIFGPGRTDRNKKNIAVRCPICENQGRDTRTKQKLIIRIDDDLCHCWVCGWKSRSALPLIRKYGTHEQFETYRSTVSSCINIDIQEIKKIKRQLSLPYDFTLVANINDERRLDVLRYLIERGLDWVDVEQWHLGVSNVEEYKHRLIIPSFDKDGKLNFIVSRAYNNKPFRKYNNSDVERSLIIFNEFNINWEKDVILCEGPFDMFKCGKNSIPLLGCDLSEDSVMFNSILINEPSIVIAMDADMKKKTIRIASLLSSYGINVKVVDVDDDPGIMSKKDFKLLLTTAKQWSWRQKFDRKLDLVFS